MKEKLLKDLRRIAASYLRAVAATVGGVQLFDAWGGRGWDGVLTGLIIALIPPTVRALEVLASDLEG